MRILLKFPLDCNPDEAWDALRSPAVFRAATFPLVTFESLESSGFPQEWPAGEHPVRARAFGLLPMGVQVIDLSFTSRADGVRLARDSGGGVDGPLAVVKHWHHTMAVSPLPDGRTLYRDQLVFRAGRATLLVWPALWAFWQWRGMRIRRITRALQP